MSRWLAGRQDKRGQWKTTFTAKDTTDIEVQRAGHLPGNGVPEEPSLRSTISNGIQYFSGRWSSRSEDHRTGESERL